MADFACVATGHSSDGSSPKSWKALGRFRVIIVVAALALAGCNANQTPNPSGQAAFGAVYPNYNPYNPIEYAQTSGRYAGR